MLIRIIINLINIRSKNMLNFKKLTSYMKLKKIKNKKILIKI